MTRLIYKQEIMLWFLACTLDESDELSLGILFNFLTLQNVCQTYQIWFQMTEYTARGGYSGLFMFASLLNGSQLLMEK